MSTKTKSTKRKRGSTCSHREYSPTEEQVPFWRWPKTQDEAATVILLKAARKGANACGYALDFTFTELTPEQRTKHGR